MTKLDAAIFPGSRPSLREIYLTYITNTWPNCPTSYVPSYER